MNTLIYPGAIAAKINAARVLLQKLGILIRDNPIPSVLPDAMHQWRQHDYVRFWHLLIEKNCFNFIIEDYSLFYFICNEVSGTRRLAFSYYDSPHSVPSLEEFICETYGPEYVQILDEEERVSVIPHYEQFVSELPFRSGVTPIRYDYSEAHYIAGKHPVSHLHVGYDNEIRISVERVLNPLSFVAFIVRQCYPDIWKRRVLKRHATDIRGDIRENLSLVEERFRCDLDDYELALK